MILSNIISFLLGFLLIFAAPYGNSYFKDWLIPVTGDYRITLFEAFVFFIAYACLIYYGFKVKKYERLLFLSLALTVLIRLISVLAADNLVISQLFSVFRYIEALLVIYILTNLFSNSKNRSFFIKGIILGVIIETIGGIIVFLISHYKGVFISNNSFILQVFLIMVYILTFMAKEKRFLMILLILILTLSVFATMTRTAWIFLLICMMLFGAVYFKKHVIRSLLLFVTLTGLIILLIRLADPPLVEIFGERINSAFSGGGSTTYRLYLWDKSIASFLDHPLLGIGSGSFSRQQEELPQVFNIELPEYYQNYDLKLSTHNTFLGVLAETGTAGLFAYFLWIISVVGICKRMFKFSDMRLKGDRYQIAAVFILISAIISDLISQYSFTPIINAFAGFVLGGLREKINPTNSAQDSPEGTVRKLPGTAINKK